MNRIIRRFLAAFLALLFTGCAAAPADLTEGIRPDLADTFLTDSAAASASEFAVQLLRETAEPGTSTLVSPLSVLSALGMTSLGAQGETLSQMEAVFGIPADELASTMCAWQSTLPRSGNVTLRLANSVWFTDESRFTVSNVFLQKNADYYGADAYQLPLDSAAVRSVNQWVSEKTDGQIKKILDDISPDAVMLLANAVSFDAEWQDIYEKQQVRKTDFTGEDGTTVRTDMMYSTEYGYLADEYAEGFVKYYKGRKYAFAALLPKKGMSVEEYLDTLTGEGLYRMLSAPEGRTVHAGIPTFESGTSVELSSVLCEMGMPDAFDPQKADFTGMGTSEAGNIFISRVLHKTTITVDERGTKAGAATVIEMTDGASAVTEEPKEVILDRPFVYMLLDCDTALPFFIGTMMDPTK
ncbi:MAG: serpin family protein [Clostridia bacterium]|nr:serpin family protein [Clostridia bacterium]